MKFVKGMIVGTVVTAGVIMMCNESNMSGKKMMKLGKRLMKDMCS